MALGKSIPTSIIVVETKIEIFFFKNFFKTDIFSSFEIVISKKSPLGYNLFKTSFDNYIGIFNFLDSSIKGQTQKI